MREYKRFTEKRKGKNVIPLLNSVCGVDLPHWTIETASDIRQYLSGNAVDRFAELEDKIENGTLTFSKFARNQEVYFIDYKYSEYACPHCGETCYEEKINGVGQGFICERIITENQDGLEIIYSIQIKDNGKVKLFTKRREEDIFFTKELAEQKLKELKGEV